MTEKRTYNLGRRAETAAETRQRLVDATSALHNARGVSAVSLRDIAEEAGVSIGTAYHHFPTYLDAVRACAAHHAVVSALPAETIFEGTRGIEARVRIFVRELCGWYERHSWLERIRAERSSYPPIEEAMTQIAGGIEQLARTAARCAAEEAKTIAALSDVAVFSALRRGGMSPTRAINRMTEAVLAWLRSRNNKRRRA